MVLLRRILWVVLFCPLPLFTPVIYSYARTKKGTSVGNKSMNMVLVFPFITVAMERYETVRGDVLQQQIAGI